MVVNDLRPGRNCGHSSASMGYVYCCITFTQSVLHCRIKENLAHFSLLNLDGTIILRC